MYARSTLLVLCSALTAPCQQDAQDATNTCYVFRVESGLTPAQSAALVANFDMLTCEYEVGREPSYVMVQPWQLELFTSMNIPSRLVERGRPYALIERGNGNEDAPPDPGYFTTAEISQEIDNLVAANPAIASKIDLTQLPGGVGTWNGNPIWGLKVSDNVNSNEDEPAMVFAAQHHARELNSPYMVIGAMRRVLAAYGTDPDITNVVNNYEVYFVPCVNPDGVDWVWCCDNLWRKNRRNNGNGTFGVDLNRNYPFLWSSSCPGATQPASETYRGPSAASEPEVQTMRALIAALRPEVYIDFHSYGQDVLFLYAPCASVTTPIRTMANNYVSGLQSILGYSTRLPSASAEAPHDHWASGGTLSFLIEVGTAFQPAFTATQNEEARVWPAVDSVLTTWRPSVRGHITSVFQNQPIEADISYTPDLFNYTETNKSRARDGRYAMWLPIGATYQVTFSAPGYQSETRAVTVTAYNSTQNLDVELMPVGLTASSLAVTGTHQIGTTTTFTYSSPGDAGAGYWIPLALNNQPPIAIGARSIPLAADALFFTSAMPGLIPNNLGIIPSGDIAVASLPIPALPTLVGLQIFADGLTLDSNYNFGVKKISAGGSFTIQ